MSRITSVRPFEVRYDEYDEGAGILFVDILSLDTADEVHSMWAEIKRIFADKRQRNTLVNLSKSRQKKMSGSARKAFQAYQDYLTTLDKTAFVVSNPVVRMLLKATVAGLNRLEEGILIFKTECEALTWLKEK